MKILTIFTIFLYTLSAQTIPTGKKITIWKLNQKNAMNAYETSLISSILMKANIPFEYKRVSTQTELMSKIQQANNSGDHFQIAINNISISSNKEKAFSFSVPYFKSAFALMGKTTTIKPNQVLKIGYIKHSNHRSKIKSMLKNNDIEFEMIPYASIQDAIRELKSDSEADQGSLNFIFSEYVTAFQNHHLNVVRVFRESDEKIGILLTKHSPLKAIIDPLLNSYMNSQQDQKFIKKYLGTSAIKYVLGSRK